MSVVQRLVSPKLPTALATHSHVELPGYDLLLSTTHHVHVLPTGLDVAQFDDALSKVLQLYPHAAGQFRHSGGRWFIELTNTAVPVEIDYKLDMSSDSLLNGDWVVQDDISPFLHHQPIDANLVNSDAPLVRLKLTFFHNETCIGVSWHHALGDAIVVSRFMHTLSQFYQGLPPKYAAPTFNKYHFPTPSSAIRDEFWPRMPHFHNTRPLTELGDVHAEWRENVEHVRWRFDNHDLAKLSSTLSGQKGTYLSKQDCLTAYLVTILNYSRSVPVQNVMNISSYRNTNASFVDENVAANLTQNVPATVPTDMAGIAAALRHALIQCREPDYLYNWMSVASNHTLETLNAAQFHLWSFPDNTVYINSYIGIDWCSAHFGYPDGSRFYTAGVCEHFLGCCRSNPTKGDDGVWKARQSIEVSTGVRPELKPKLVETLALGIQYALDNERSQTIPFALSKL